MGLIWRQPTPDRWTGFADGGDQVGLVALTVVAGRDRYWFAWRRDGTPDGLVVGEFPTAEAAMVAVDEAGGDGP